MVKKAIYGVVATFLLAALVYWLYLPMSKKEKPALTRAERILESDREMLSNPSARPDQIYGALTRLAEMTQDKQAFDYAMQNVGHESAVIRRAVAVALRFYSDPSVLAALENLFDEGEAEVRLSALESLVALDVSGRQALLDKILSAPERISGLEMVVLQAAKLKGNRPEGHPAFLQLVKMTKSEEAGVALAATFQLGRLAPGSAQLVLQFEKLLSESPHPAVLAEVIRFLAPRKSKSLEAQSERLVSLNDEKVMLALVQTLHLSCLGNRWQLMQKMVESRPKAALISAIVQEAQQLGGEPAQRLLKSMAKNGLIQQDHTLTTDREAASLCAEK